MLRRYEIEDLMRCVVVSPEEGYRKPHPRLFRNAVGLLGLPASEVRVCRRQSHARTSPVLARPACGRSSRSNTSAAHSMASSRMRSSSICQSCRRSSRRLARVGASQLSAALAAQPLARRTGERVDGRGRACATCLLLTLALRLSDVRDRALEEILRRSRRPPESRRSPRTP